MFRRLFLSIFFVIGCAMSLNAQQPWTLQQCIDQALKYNIQIKQSSLNNDLNKIQVDQSTLTMLPSINSGASQNYFFGRSIDPYTNLYTTKQVSSSSFSLSGNLTLFEGFQLQNTLKESKLNYLSSQNDLKKIQDDISITVVNYYLQVLFNDDMMKIAFDQMKTTETQRNRMKRMFELGSVNKGNYLDLEAQYASDELKYIQAESQYDQSILQLTQILELDTIKNFSVTKPELNLPALDSSQAQIDNIFRMALNNQPDIKSAEYKMLSAEKRLSISRGLLYPRIYVNGTISTNYSTSSKDVSFQDYPPVSTATGYTSSGDTVFTYLPNQVPIVTDIPFKRQFDDNLGKTIGFTLQVPIFNGWSVRSNIARSKINLEQSRLNNELTKKNLYKSVQQAVIDAIASGKKYIASQRSIDALQENFNFNQQRLDLGLISTYDYLISKNGLANAQASLLQAKYDYIFRIKILDFYQGKPLTF